jgi:hypothetical protein
VKSNRLIKGLFVVAAVPVSGVLLLLIAGLFIPAQHELTRAITLRVKPEAAFHAIADVENLPAWASGVLKVERLPDRDGKEVTQQTLKGGMQVVVLTSEFKPNTRLVRTMGEASAPFFGAWAYDFTPEGEGCRVVLRESGEIRNPFFRAMVWIFGQDKQVTQHLNDLARKFGETVKVVRI